MLTHAARAAAERRARRALVRARFVLVLDKTALNLTLYKVQNFYIGKMCILLFHFIYIFLEVLVSVN